MNKGLKIFLIVCAALIASGALLAGLGFLLGGDPDLTLSKRRPLFGGAHEINSVFSGVLLEESQDLEAFTSIDIAIGVSDVKLIPSDGYRVECAYDQGYGKPRIQVTDGVLHIEDKVKYRGLDLSLRNLFGVNYKDGKGPRLFVYYPADTAFVKVNVNNDLGSLKMENLTAQNLLIDLDLGDLDLKQVSADQAEINLSLGSISAVQFETKGLTVTADLGDVNLEGAFYGTTEVDCDLGDIDLTSSVPLAEYHLVVGRDLGNSTLNGSSLSDHYDNGASSAPNYMDLQCDLGDVDVRLAN